MGARPGFLFNNSNDEAPENFDKYYKWTAEAFTMLNYASEFFDIDVCRGRKNYRLAIENGKITRYETADTVIANGTTVEFKLSSEVFGDVSIIPEMLLPMIKYAAEKYPFADFRFNFERVTAGEVSQP